MGCGLSDVVERVKLQACKGDVNHRMSPHCWSHEPVRLEVGCGRIEDKI